MLSQSTRITVLGTHQLWGSCAFVQAGTLVWNSCYLANFKQLRCHLLKETCFEWPGLSSGSPLGCRGLSILITIASWNYIFMYLPFPLGPKPQRQGGALFISLSQGHLQHLGYHLAPRICWTELPLHPTAYNATELENVTTKRLLFIGHFVWIVVLFSVREVLALTKISTLAVIVLWNWFLYLDEIWKKIFQLVPVWWKGTRRFHPGPLGIHF